MSGALGYALRFGPALGSSVLSTLRSKWANQENRRQQGEALGYVDENAGALQDRYNALVADQTQTNQYVLYGNADLPKGMQPNPTQLQGYRGLYDATMGQANQFHSDLTGQYANRLTTGMGMLEGLGESAREDLNRQYTALDSNVQAGLRDRGFSGSMLASGSLNVQGQKDRSTRALNEQLQQQQLGLYSNLSGDYLNALGQGQANIINLGSSLGQQFIGAQQGVQQQANQAQLSSLGYADANMNRRLGIMQGYPAQGPPPGNVFDAFAAGYNNQQAYNMAQAANAARNDWIGPTLTQGAFGLGGAGLMAYGLSQA